MSHLSYTSLTKAVFFDRDGTINSDEGHYYMQKGGLACAAYSCEGDMRLKKLLKNGKKSTLNEWTIRHLKYPFLVK